jgi:uncharacterized DUF497 family protein/uncharacterized protein (DUF4415 family)
MKLIFDVHRDASNIAKYGLSLGLAHTLEWPEAQCKVDTRREYGEPRRIGYVTGDNYVYCVVFSDRPLDSPRERRIISLRRATRVELLRLAAMGVETTHGDRCQETTPQEDDATHAAMAHDADTYELGVAEFRQLRACPTQIAVKQVEITLSLDSDLAEKLKAMGSDWQARVNDSLRAWLG